GVPGRRVQLYNAVVFGGALSCSTAQPQTILVRVFGWTCTSMPITTSHALDNGRDLRPDLARLFVGARHAKDDALTPLRPQDLESDGQSIRRPARDADPGQTREVATKRQDIAQVH